MGLLGVLLMGAGVGIVMTAGGYLLDRLIREKPVRWKTLGVVALIGALAGAGLLAAIVCAPGTAEVDIRAMAGVIAIGVGAGEYWDDLETPRKDVPRKVPNASRDKREELARLQRAAEEGPGFEWHPPRVEEEGPGFEWREWQQPESPGLLSKIGK